MNPELIKKIKPKTSWLWIHEDFITKENSTHIKIPYRYLLKIWGSQAVNNELSFLYKYWKLIPMVKEDSTLGDAFEYLGHTMETKTGLKLTSKIAVERDYNFPDSLFYVNTINQSKMSLCSNVLNYILNKDIEVKVNYTLVIPKTEDVVACRNVFCFCEECNPVANTRLKNLRVYE